MEFTFSDQVLRQFGFLQERYSFWGAEEYYTHQAFGSGSLLIESDRYSLEFILDGKGPQVAIHVGRPGQPRVDLAWVFAHLTHGISGAAPWLYYAPSYPLMMGHEDCINWQMERLADILQPMWPAIFIFLDMDGQHSADFIAFKERAERSMNENLDDSYRRPAASLIGRAPLNFAEQSDVSFAYLRVYGFRRVYGDPIFVRYEKDQGDHPIYLNVFHGPHSYQVGIHTGWVQDDSTNELNFDLEELASWQGHTYHPVTAHKTAEVRTALNQTARQFRRFAAPLLAGDSRLLEALHSRRIDAARRVSRAWAERNRG